LLVWEVYSVSRESSSNCNTTLKKKSEKRRRKRELVSAAIIAVSRCSRLINQVVAGDHLTFFLLFELGMEKGGSLVLGLDSSTQGLKAVTVRTDNLKMVAEWSVNYDLELPHYSTRGGVHHYKDQGGAREAGEVTAPALLWVEALQLLLEKIRKDPSAPLGRVRAVSASGQQHGSVYWRTGAQSSHLARLRNADCEGEDEDLLSIMQHPQSAFSVAVRSTFPLSSLPF